LESFGLGRIYSKDEEKKFKVFMHDAHNLQFFQWHWLVRALQVFFDWHMKFAYALALFLWWLLTPSAYLVLSIITLIWAVHELSV